VKRLAGADWSSVETLHSEFTSSQGAGMSTDERAAIQLWLSAISEARSMFEAASPEHAAGFARRVRLKNAPGGEIIMRLVAPSRTESQDPSGPYLLYMQEREVQVGDVAPLWARRRPDRPWEVWAQIVGTPPENQIVGLSFQEAAELARELHCELPVLTEWKHAAQSLQLEGPLGFEGGVWEWCGGSTLGSAPLIAGGCWLDRDPRVHETSPQAESLTGPSHFGTIGFRLCKRFEVPREAFGEN
jgi:hypothetical protein